MQNEFPVGAALIEQASGFACAAHQRVGQLRKYSGQPYEEHLRRVAEIVATVSDDAEMIAAAWLHDVVEDTPVTIEEIGREFGPGVRELVDALTDVSRPQDGNRAARKAADREHLARASARAQTVKLADLIDNCQDICKHDAGFGRVFVGEMAALLKVLTSGDAALVQRAQRTLEKWSGRVKPKRVEPDTDPVEAPVPLMRPAYRRALRAFSRHFHAEDVAEPLSSFDARGPARYALALPDGPVVGVREGGSVVGYALRAALGEGSFAEAMHPIQPTQLLDRDAGLADVVLALSRHDYCFVTLHEQVVAYAGRDQMQGPVARMWLFGMITAFELAMTEGLRSMGSAIDWQPLLSPARLTKARELQQARAELGRPAALLDCLQLSDKIRIVLELEEQPLVLLRGNSKAESQRLVRDLENLRNSLAHAQDIVTHDWAQIARLAQRMEALAEG